MPNTPNIKTEDLCARCHYGFYNNCFVRDAPCTKCPRYDPDAPSDGWRDVKTCQCMQIREGDACPYFEEAVKDAENHAPDRRASDLRGAVRDEGSV